MSLRPGSGEVLWKSVMTRIASLCSRNPGKLRLPHPSNASSSFPLSPRSFKKKCADTSFLKDFGSSSRKKRPTLPELLFVFSYKLQFLQAVRRCSLLHFYLVRAAICSVLTFLFLIVTASTVRHRWHLVVMTSPSYSTLLMSMIRCPQTGHLITVMFMGGTSPIPTSWAA